MRHVAAIEHRIQDFRFAARQLLRYRGFASVAVVVLALGVAASASIFGFVDAALIRPLPYEEPSRLFSVFGPRPDAAVSQKRGGASYLDFLDWRDLVVRTQPSEPALFPSLVAAIHEIRPDTIVGGLTTMTERISGMPSASMNRSLVWLVGGFAAVALILSVVGLYGVVAYTVSQRAREIGIRMALGAVPQSVYRLVLGEAVWLVGIGAALGAIGAAAVGIFMRHLLFDVEPWDVPTMLVAACVLTMAVLLASYVPARRAAEVNPVDVLRAE